MTDAPITAKPRKAHHGVVQSFMFDNIPVRGKLLRLSNITDHVPSLEVGENDMALLMAELVTSAVCFATDLKGKAYVTLQVHSPGPLPLLIAKCNWEGTLRAYAKKDGEDITKEDIRRATGDQSIFAVTVDFGREGENYQSFVPIKSTSISASVEAYFEQSAQLRTAFRVYTTVEEGKTSAAAVFLQAMPERGGQLADDDWKRLNLLLDTITEAEILSPKISEKGMLIRLFGMDDIIRVFEPQKLYFKEEANRKRMARALKSLGQATCTDLLEDGQIEVTDEYSGKTEVFTKDDIDALFAAADTDDDPRD
jgi:molecular chaperone Hsp33